MFKKRKLMILLALCLGLASPALAETFWWSNNDPNNHLWSTADNWWLLSVPTIDDIVYINRPGKFCVVDSSVTAVCSALGVGYSSSPARLIMSGGTITVNGLFRIGIQSASQGTVEFEGGTIDCIDFIMRQTDGAIGTLNMKEGVLIVAGNLVSRIQDYVYDGWIKAYNGNGRISVDYNNSNPGKTTVKAFDRIRADFDDDGLTTLKDYSKFASAWLAQSEENSYNGLYDLEVNNSIDIYDLRLLAIDWLYWPYDQVEITVNANDIQHEISPHLTGFHTVYSHEKDVIWENGEIVGYLQDIHASVGRYPGGAVVSYHHWQQPIARGWTDSWNPSFDGDYGDPNDFMDIDEFMAKCQQIGCKPVLGINVQSGVRYDRLDDSIAEAVALVQYCKDQGYDVECWYIDNEPYLNNSIPALTAAEYAGYINQFVPPMKAVDPNLKIVANWRAGFYESWNSWETLLTIAGDNIDIADVHWYWDWGQSSWYTWLYQNPMRWENQWLANGVSFVEEIKKFRDEVTSMGYENIELASFEWNVGPNENEMLSPFQYALVQSEILGQFIEGDLYMSMLWTLHWPPPDQGLVPFANRYFLDPITFEPNPIYHVYKMYANALGQQFVSSQTDRDHIRPVTVLSNDGNTLWIYLLHKSGEREVITARLNISGFTPSNAEAIAFTASELSSDATQLKNRAIFFDTGTGQWSVTLPSHSLTMITFQK